MYKIDVLRVSEIEKEIFDSPWSYNSFLKILESEFNHYFILEKQNEIIGYFGMQIILDECQIHNVGILKNQRSKGYGNSIFDFIMDYCKYNKISHITLEVRESNFKAIRLYEKYGFKKVATIKSYYNKPTEDGFLMKLDLGE